jgi:hypothetical protein
LGDPWGEDMKYIPWLTLSLDLTPMMDQTWDRDYRIAQVQRDKLAADRVAYHRATEAEKSRVELRLENLDLRIKSQAETLEWARQMALATAARLTEGSMNPLEVQQYRLDFLSAEATLEELLDQRWYWELYLALL